MKTEPTIVKVSRYQEAQIVRYDAGIEVNSVETALIASRKLLEEEGRWCQSSWYSNQDQHVDPDTPFCNDWKVCAEGAVAAVVLGVARKRYFGLGDPIWGPWEISEQLAAAGCYETEAMALYKDAVAQLRDAGERLTIYSYDSAWGYNDYYFTNRQQVLGWFDVAIEMSRGG